MKKVEEELQKVFRSLLIFLVFFSLPRPAIQVEVMNKDPRNSLKQQITISMLSCLANSLAIRTGAEKMGNI